MSGKIEAIMEPINDPGNDSLLCEKHKALAHAFLRNASEAVRHASVEDPIHLQMEVNKSLVLFLWSRKECSECRTLQQHPMA
jgi:hypothetical protein